MEHLSPRHYRRDGRHSAALAGSSPWIAVYAGTDTLICHNANFNIGVLWHACTADDIPWPQVDFLCTMILARRALRLPSYRLPFVAAECGVELSGRHQVLINARGAALVTVALARQHEAATPADLADALAIRTGHVEPGRYRPTVRRPQAATAGTA
jgi:DNA polymerase III epsilon subunit-like protein